MHPDRLFQGRRVTQTQSSVKAFFLKAGYAQMNDWSRLAVDRHDAKTRGRKANCTNTNTLLIRQYRARAYQEAWVTKSASSGARGQLRLSLTTSMAWRPLQRMKMAGSVDK